MHNYRFQIPLLRTAALAAVILAGPSPAAGSLPLEKHVASLHPAPGQTTARGERFILIRFEKDLPGNFDPETIRLAIDARDVTSDARRSRFHVSYPIKEAMAGGEHTVLLSLELPGHGPQTLSWSFVVADRQTVPATPAVAVDDRPLPAAEHERLTGAPRPAGDRPRPRASGKLWVRSRQVDLSGPGQALRQEPPHTDELELQAILDLAGLRITPDFRLTSDETRQLQPRDRLSLGLEIGPASLRLGDANPTYQDLVLSGLRVRGATLDLDLGDWQLAASHGEIRRATPAAALGGATATPVARRRLSAFRTERGWTAAGLVIGLTAMTASDDVGSAATTAQALDNQVYGVDFELLPAGGWRLFGELGHSDLDGDSRLAFAAGGEDSAYRLGLEATHDRGSVLAEGYRLGAAYRSLGRPTLRVDQEGFHLRATHRLLAGKLRVNGGYRHFRDNLSGQLPATRRHDDLNAALSFRPGKRSPSFTLGGRWFARDDGLPHADRFAVDETLASYRLAARHTVDWSAGKTHALLSVGWTDRRDRARGTDSGSTTSRVQLSHGFRAPWHLRIGWSDNDRDLASGSGTEVTAFDLGLRGELLDGRLELEAGTTARLADGSLPGFDSERILSTLSGKLQLRADLELELGARWGEFDDARQPANDYDENIFFINLGYGFSFEL